MLLGVCHGYILAINGAPRMLNVLCFTFTHNSKIIVNNNPLYYVAFYTHILKS